MVFDRGPPRAASWSERRATFLVFLSLGLGAGAWAAALPAIKTALDLTDAELGIALFAVAAGSVASTLAVGSFAGRLGTGRATSVAAVALGFVFLLPGFATSLAQLVTCGALIGLAGGALDVSMNGHAGDVERRWGTPIMSSFHAAFSLGGLAGSALGGGLASLGWSARGQLGCAAGLAFLVFAFALPHLGRGHAPERGPRGTGLVLPRGRGLALVAAAICDFLLEGAVADWSAVYLTDVTASSVGFAASAFAGFSVSMAAGRLFGDRIVRIVGARRLVVLGGGLATLGLALVVLVPVPVVGAAGFTLMGIGLSNIVPITFSAAARIGASPAAGIAMIASLGYAGFLSGPPAIGGLAALAGLRIALACLLLCTLGTCLAGAAMPAQAGQWSAASRRRSRT